ncbi:N-acetyltransferase [Paenimyroides tangerinum]|uniref:N-acetyltransferase n=1 Tax=Paenimyroides tangerinum TaxID=2488728 RepID=A0A3P3W864_9FLAO|nr:GNAT family N-acetyltransferase [Paenimyroides tangerinum]RRJ90537.1 N-acetyltransferase [Paenimyroides tangerinum]
MEIIHKEFENKGAFIAQSEGKKAGEMTYSKAGEKLIIIDHTEVDSAFGGQGVGKKMVLAAVDFARENQIKILPLCPFAKAAFDKDSSIQDVL